MSRRVPTSGALAIVVAVLVLLAAGSAWAGDRIPGISGPAFNFTAKAGEVSTPDGGSIHFWGYQDDDNQAGFAAFPLPQYPGPTLILNQNDSVTIDFKSDLPFGQCSSIVFPGHAVTASGGSAGLLTQESCGFADVVTYSFTASRPGTYIYYSGTEAGLQIEMGLVGVIIVRPTLGEGYLYNHPDTGFDHEVMFLLTSMDPSIHALAEQNRFSEIDLTTYWPVYWFINGRAAPDDLVGTFLAWLPHQPYNCTPRIEPGQRIAVRLIGGGQGQHPLHLHGNDYDIVARDGRLLLLDDGTTLAPRTRFTTLSVPGQTVDQIFSWSGEKLGWDIYGTPADGLPAHDCIDGDADDFGDVFAGSTYEYEYCPDHGKPLPVVLPEKQNLAFGAWWSGSPFMGNVEPLPPGEGGLNPFGGFFFMWHSHAEKELTNFDIFPGGMLSMMVVQPPGTIAP